ncbi:M15 family metallopeptidase [Ulvibacter antarcticus]|uniref:D-alanyl-D-alanine carboxypeptidase-like protein n=1 Tax=Ulvibacter antarcticus TaxID=442714 RepID=A0A3L9YBM0_9FLAO|nr:M15 family metallopeptidase [Ulvibacter antarcticus]RMA57774.1 D-alanyl-D-alanine carboxypeptidase-like protein [Ulvibacter antarcticus]
MNRNKFIKITALASAGIGILPQLSFRSFQESFTRDQLIGKGNKDIVGNTYTSKMQKDTSEAFQKMKLAASEENIQIEVVSAYRSFQRQKEIYEGKYKKFTKQGLSPMAAIEKIIEYSTIPGTSRHHWGTDIDIIDANAKPRPASVLQPQLFHGDGPFCKLKDWLTKNAATYGFYEVYTDNANRKGFKYEPWHFSYAPVSIPMLAAYKKLDVQKILQEEKIAGSEYFSEAFIGKYRSENILDINPELL